MSVTHFLLAVCLPFSEHGVIHPLGYGKTGMQNKGKVGIAADAIRGSALFRAAQVIHECTSFPCLQSTGSQLLRDEKVKMFRVVSANEPTSEAIYGPWDLKLRLHNSS